MTSPMAPPQPRGSILDIPRSLAFYLVFYTGTVFLVIWVALMMSVSEHRFRSAIRSWGKYHRACCRYLLGIRRESNVAHPRGGVLYAIRHESFYEAIELPATFDTPVVFAKMELMRLPLWGKAGIRYGLIGVERDAGAKALRTMLTEARRLIANGRPLVIFPEGTRVPHGSAAPLQSGFAGLYKLLNLPVIPVAVNSGPLYHRLWKRSGTVRYHFGEEIPAGLPRDEVEARVLAALNVLHD
jgi:1-acyl-sn-glycerol-3-phosphate acyltransferase